MRLPCHPASSPVARRFSSWTRCARCGTLARRAGPPPEGLYSERYAFERGHFDPASGACKARSLERWLDDLRIPPEGQTICEVGCGAGWTLLRLHERGAWVMGIEPIGASRAHAQVLGIPPGRLFETAAAELPRPVSLWLFLDSFEHLTDPLSVLRWARSQSNPAGARALLVCPDGGSASRRILGPLWPHDTPDHWIHYTRRGVEDLFDREGFRPERRFRPRKCLTAAMALRHAGLLLGGGRARVPAAPPEKARARGDAAPASFSFWFNIGQMGILFRCGGPGIEPATADAATRPE